VSLVDELSDKKLQQELDEELSYWLAFSKMSGAGLGIVKTRTLYEHFGSLKEVWNTPIEELRQLTWMSFEMTQAFKEARKNIDPETLLLEVRATGVRAYHLFDPRFPANLREMHDPPFVIFALGNLSLENLPCPVGVVGTRTPTTYGEKLTKEVAKGLAENGATVVSGMAVGVDSFGHWAAIKGGGRTVAVLATGVDICYPSSNKHLYQELIEGEHSCVISEYFPGTKAERWSFPARNRILAGLSQAVAVIEAGDDSGSLITANMAFDMNREVFAVPGRVDSPMSKGTNKLIASNKAHLITSHIDIMETMRWAKARTADSVPMMVQLYGREREIYELIATEPRQFESLAEYTGLSAGELSATLTMLELAGIVIRLPGDWYECERQASEIR
jgi:DNA processing protein